ncbi:MAG: hypothetical protein RL018_1312 [Pseudomonadota bacterium]
MYSYLVHTTPKPSGKNYTSVKPKPKAMQNANGKEDCASYQEAPKSLCKASKDVGKPSQRDCDANKPAHHASFTKMPSAFR